MLALHAEGAKSFRFLQIISAANKQYAGARAPDRQQAAEPAAALTACIPLRRFRRFAVFYAATCIPLRRFAVFSAAIAYSDIAADCCDSRIVHWQEILSPSDCPLWLPRSNAALAMASIRFSGGLYCALFLVRNFS